LNELLKYQSNEGDIILDPFCGSGTTLKVANDLNRKWIGIDINSNTEKIINKRIKLNLTIDNFIE
jgi:DNA modification methylase